MMVADQELVRVREAAKQLHISEWTIRDYIRRGQIETYAAELGKGYYVDVNEIREKRIPHRRDR